jgi:phosphate transport system protein
MSREWQRNLNALYEQIRLAARLVDEAIPAAVLALVDEDEGLVHEVIAADTVLHEQALAVEATCVKMLALHQPVARDLRLVFVAAKIATELERMGKLAVNIAERALSLRRQEPIEAPPLLEEMTGLTVQIVRQSLDALAKGDADLARAVCQRDDEVDECNRCIIEELIARMKQAPALVESTLSLFSAVRQLERIADHATHIAEQVVYLVEGEIVRRRPACASQRVR